jgi:hypothetical protein
MTEETEKTKLPEKIEVVDEFTGKTLRFERNSLMVLGCGLPSASIAINDCYLTQNIDGAVIAIEGDAKCSAYLLKEFHLPPEYVINEVHITLILNERSDTQEFNTFKQYLDQYDIKLQKPLWGCRY